jgi:hypothetical protein
MNDKYFDDVTRSLRTGSSRRKILAAVTSGVLGTLVFIPSAQADCEPKLRRCESVGKEAFEEVRHVPVAVLRDQHSEMADIEDELPAKGTLIEALLQVMMH